LVPGQFHTGYAQPCPPASSAKIFRALRGRRSGVAHPPGRRRPGRLCAASSSRLSSDGGLAVVASAIIDQSALSPRCIKKRNSGHSFGFSVPCCPSRRNCLYTRTLGKMGESFIVKISRFCCWSNEMALRAFLEDRYRTVLASMLREKQARLPKAATPSPPRRRHRTSSI
jgi:hypothetical protein